MDHLIDHYYIGSAQDAQNSEILRLFEIAVMINLTEVPDPVYEGLEYFQLNQPDNAPVLEATAKLFLGFIDSLSDHRPVLIHCAAGISRTAAFTSALLVYRYGLSWDESLALVKQKRPRCNPSPVLLESLRMHLPDISRSR